MEATGSYGEALAEFLFKCNFKVSVINPARIKGFAQSKLCRVKTDKADSTLIAEFCFAMNPECWTPVSQHIKELRQWIGRLDSLITMKLQETNKLESAEESITTHIRTHISFLDKNIKEVENTIKETIKISMTRVFYYHLYQE